MRVILGLYWDNGKNIGNYYLGSTLIMVLIGKYGVL